MLSTLFTLDFDHRFGSPNSKEKNSNAKIPDTFYITINYHRIDLQGDTQSTNKADIG
jgi:hypothetical protein